LLAFARGEVKRLVCKPKIGAWGLNFQKCHNQVIFPSHSFEQYYQVVRRCYRFGQTKPVSVHMVLTEGEQRIADNLERKKHQVETLFRELVKHMQDALHLAKSDVFVEKVEVPKWL
jgi:SNF2 family DNA or RNA helicase